ncbi:hypothetical protein JR316_0012211 [Psilocybe cubensis]|uniref:Uncharacterized protein n=2 Tax=Psilocybe cubensis TaxID=181762 RepID=A0A8H7XR17_PSICU|nr:hypothetical protein JR316_0012211 [Psilocybe cubensis]KAH9475100.1 hypothetical protein JR316_0012211 [Psilocybe cubensis]
MFFLSAAFATLALLTIRSALGVVIPGASTPLFYFVSSSPSSPSNLLPLRMNGGAGGYSTLTGTGPIGQFYFTQGRLTALNPAGSTSQTYMPVLASQLGSSGCSTYGQLGFVMGASAFRCARYDGFQIQSNIENSQLGAHLVINYVGGFYACGVGQEVWYKLSPGDGPSDCSPITLYTVPVTV